MNIPQALLTLVLLTPAPGTGRYGNTYPPIAVRQFREGCLEDRATRGDNEKEAGRYCDCLIFSVTDRMKFLDLMTMSQEERTALFNKLGDECHNP